MTINGENNIRMCMCHFHHVIITSESKDKHELKLEVPPTLFLTKFNLNNATSCRLVSALEDLQFVTNHIIESETQNNTIKIK